MQDFSKIVHWILLLLLVVACEEIDNQDISLLSEKDLSVINPTPTAGVDLQTNNANHKILMAVIDSGVDYNHPWLINNIHFNIDESGNINGTGWDYIGDDAWPSPYVARTLDKDPAAPANRVEESRAIRARVANLEAQASADNKYYQPERAIEQERESGSYHGTHVAGLMVYDQPALGLIPYRVIPSNVVYKNGSRDYNGSGDAVERILQALNKAVRDGVRVINLSLGTGSEKGVNEKEIDQSFKRQMMRVQEFATQHPNIIIVAAAGNDGKWIDSSTRVQLPCGVVAKNILCVGAIDRTDKLAYFTNLIFTGSPFLFAPGTEIYSTYPFNMCDSDKVGNVKQVFGGTTMAEIEKECSRVTRGFAKLSGTSMASPIAARSVALTLLSNPDLNGAEAIQTLLDSAETFYLGTLALKKIRVKKPSWYSLFNQSDDSFARVVIPMIQGDDYFDFVVAPN